MPNSLLWTLPAAAALIGALLLGIRLQVQHRRFAIGAGLGALSGVIGSQLFMLPLQYCTFDPERDPIDFAAGFLLVALGMIAVIAPVGWLADRWLTRAPRTPIAQQGTFKGRLTPILLLLPTVIILALFLYYPSLDTFRLSTLLARLGAPRTAFVCVDNFTRLVNDGDYARVILITFGMSFAIVGISMALSLLIATAASQPIRGASIYRTLLIWPYAISPVVAGIIFLLLFNPTGGIINYALGRLNPDWGIPWLNNAAAAPWAVIIASVWKSLGFNVLFYIAGLQNVPKDLLEAASIDGANAVQRFRRIVIPLLSPITFFLIITNITYAFFESFGTIDALTPGGGPLESTTTMMYRIYEVGISNNDLGKGAAESILLFALVIGLTVLQFRTTARGVTYGA